MNSRAAGLLPRTVPGHVSHIQIELLQCVLDEFVTESGLAAIANTKYERSLVAKGATHCKPDIYLFRKPCVVPSCY